MKTLRISAPHFVAGVVIGGERVVKTAPILRYMTNWTEVKVKAYCGTKGWKVEEEV